MTLVETKLAELGYELPQPPDPIGTYLPVTRSGNIMWMAGVGSRRANGEHIAGKLGADLTVEQGYEAARWAALNLLARMKAELGDLDRVTRILKVVGMVNSDPAFTDQAAVVDGASDLFVALYGERGQHARSAPAWPSSQATPPSSATASSRSTGHNAATAAGDRQRNVRGSRSASSPSARGLSGGHTSSPVGHGMPEGPPLPVCRDVLAAAPSSPCTFGAPIPHGCRHRAPGLRHRQDSVRVRCSSPYPSW